jgi:hypothetical protein
MPTISVFYGIAILMRYREHPPPHFHASYGEYRATYAIASGELLEGRLPKRADRLVREWATRHAVELADLWERARQFEPLGTIEPLE